MTSEQAEWMNKHRPEGYRVIGTLPGGCQWVRRGMLHADGTFDLQQGRARPPVRVGTFEVGVLELITQQSMRGP